MGKEIKEKCKDCVYYNEKMDYPMVDGQTTHLNCMSIKCDYRKVTKDLKIVRLKNKIIDLEVKLEEKEKEETKRMEDFEKCCQEYYRSDKYKKDFAIAELEKVKEQLEPKYFDYEQINYLTNTIDQQISNLKGGE